MKQRVNPETSNFDLLGGTTTLDVTIPQLTADPSNPSQESAWVLRSGAGGSGGGKPIGLLLSLTTTGSGSGFTYQFSYRTKQDTTLRATLS